MQQMGRITVAHHTAAATQVVRSTAGSFAAVKGGSTVRHSLPSLFPSRGQRHCRSGSVQAQGLREYASVWSEPHPVGV